MFKGKRLSILGDSISTYKGVSNDASANSTLFYNPFFYREPFPLEKTYWKRLMDSLGLTLCVNNSRSGGNLSGEAHTESGVNRADNLHKDDGTLPEFIIVFMGINDLGRRVSPSVFSADYEKTLMKLSKRYPNAKVFCASGNTHIQSLTLQHLPERPPERSHSHNSRPELSSCPLHGQESEPSWIKSDRQR